MPSDCEATLHRQRRPTPPAAPHEPPRFVLATLCLTQLVGWGVLFYAFPVVTPAIVADTGWSSTVVSGAFSLSLLAAAGAGVWVGRVLDQHGPHRVMTAGSVTATFAIAAVAVAPGPGAFALGWLLAGLAQAAVLYPPAFAALTRWYGPARVRALTRLTLVGGLASTVFAPLTAALLDHFGWRQTFLVLAAVLAVVTIPAHALGLRVPWPGGHLAMADGVPATPSVGPIVRSRPFVTLAAAMAFTGFALGTATIGLVPLLIERGWAGTAAAWALGVTGLAQLVGRIAYPAITRRTGPRARTALVPLASTLPLGVLAFCTQAVAVFGACLVLGVVRGGFSLVEATAVADRWGTGQFGALYGVLSAPTVVGVALAPWAGALLVGSIGGYPVVFGALAALTLVTSGVATGTGVVPR